ncbi:uncharacterized protein B4U80_04080 [Leptotrombidium deliense]|uniref:Fibronectin type-III domain-containing protein n=1 Tax=Leptotrombidium deliense TaxID=299467 RepID=A0A443SVJ3_9ACAR|nr:uncharacterized protein B4U80_04080 [Leptotrombidium deliense]
MKAAVNERETETECDTRCDCESHTHCDAFASSFVNSTNIKSILFHCFAALPKAPKDCEIYTNRSRNAFQVKCVPVNQNNGKSHKYYLELYDRKRNVQFATVEQLDSPSFSVSNTHLPQNESFIFVIYAKNENGKSAEVVLSTETEKMMRRKADIDDSSLLNVRLIAIWTVAALAVVAIAVTVGVAVTNCVRNYSSRKE